MNKKSLLKRILRIILWTIGSLLGLLLLTILLIRLPYVQNKIVAAIEKNLKQKLDTELSVGGFYLNFPKTIELTDFYLEDQQQDTLVYFNSLAVDADLWALTQSTVEVNTFTLEGLVGRIHRKEQKEAFNYQFVINAFTSADTTSGSSNSSWKFYVEEVAIGPVDFIFDDRPRGQYYEASWQKLNVEFNQLQFDTLQIALSTIDLEGANINIELKDQSQTVESESTMLQLPAISVGNLNIKQSKVDFKNPKQHLETRIGTIGLHVDEMDLPHLVLAFDELKLEDSFVHYQLKTDSTSQGKADASPEVPAWKVSLNSLKLMNNELHVDLDTTERLVDQFDPAHIVLKNITANLTNSSFEGSALKTNIETLSFSSDGNLLQLQGNVTNNSTSLAIQDTQIGINQSQLNLDATINYPASDPFGLESKVEATVETSLLYRDDLSYFVPALNDLAEIDALTIALRTQGSFEELNVENITLEADQTQFIAQGSLKNIAQTDAFSFNLDTVNLTTRRKLIENIFPETINPLPVELPDSIHLLAIGVGSLESFAGHIDLASNYGKVSLTVDSLSFDGNQPGYGLQLITEAFDFGKLLNQKGQLNKMGVRIDLRGRGFDLENMIATVEGSLSNVQFNAYTYARTQFNGNVNNGVFEARAAINDSNLKAELSANYKTGPSTNTHVARLNIEKANLEALNLSLTPLEIEGELSADFSSPDYERFNGSAAIRNFRANNGLDTYRVDSLLVVSANNEQRSNLSIDSDIMSGNYAGNVNLFAIREALQQHINNYYTLTDGFDSTRVKEVNFDANFKFRNTDLITEILLPELTEFTPGELTASFNSAEDHLDFQFNIPHLTYSGINVDSFRLTTASLNKQLVTSLKVKHAYSSNIELTNLAIDLALADDKLNTQFSIKDSVDRYKYFIQGEFESLDSLYRFNMASDSLLLAYERWTVEQNKPFLIDPNGSRDDVTLKLGNNDQHILFQTSKTDSLFRINFDAFNLNTISQALEKNKGFISGLLDGELGLMSSGNAFGVVANLSLRNLGLLGQKWGTLTVKSNYRSSDAYNAIIDLNSSKNRARLTVNYDFTTINNLTVQAEIEKFELETIAPLVEENIAALTGRLSGNIGLKGGLSHPNINGTLRFQETEFNPVALNSRLNIVDEQIEFRNSTIRFNNFAVLDNLENRAVIDGSIEMVNTSFYRLNLDIKSNEFMVLNTNRSDNDLYYGQLRVNGKGKITGTTARPSVELDMTLAENCELTYLVPETEYNVLNNENIVQFVSHSKKSTDEIQNIRTDSLDFQGIDLAATINITESSVFNVVIDPITEDQLSVKGESTLNLGINPTGDINLSGRYVVSDGSYNFSFYKLIKREFNIEKGSSIIWSGDPYDAQLDIRASNRVEAPPIDLMISQIQNTTSTDLNRYKQRLPFLVILNIEGFLSKPQIYFKLDMPQEQRNAFGGQVYARLVDLNSRESELNKQVFALLLLQRFISENPLNSEGGYDMEDEARRSVSRLLSDQLNRLTDNIDGINLSVDLESYQDYSDGTAQATTQLELGVSKSLFNDQLEVKVSGNVNLEGQNQQNFSDYIGDLALEYKITEDGRLRITGFRRSDFDVISGEVIETGAGIIYVRDYNAFKELFKRRE